MAPLVKSIPKTGTYHRDHKQDNRAIIQSATPVLEQCLDKVHLLRLDFERLEQKMPQLQEVCDKLESISDYTLSEVRLPRLPIQLLRGTDGVCGFRLILSRTNFKLSRFVILL